MVESFLLISRILSTLPASLPKNIYQSDFERSIDSQIKTTQTSSRRQCNLSIQHQWHNHKKIELSLMSIVIFIWNFIFFGFSLPMSRSTKMNTFQLSFVFFFFAILNLYFCVFIMIRLLNMGPIRQSQTYSFLETRIFFTWYSKLIDSFPRYKSIRSSRMQRHNTRSSITSDQASQSSDRIHWLTTRPSSSSSGSTALVVRRANKVFGPVGDLRSDLMLDLK